MGKFKSCPSCGSTKKGHAVWRCSKCKRLYCANNCKPKFLGIGDCPYCESSQWGAAGEVDPSI